MRVLFAIVGVLGLAMRTHTNNEDYNQNILQAEKAATSEEKVQYYALSPILKNHMTDQS